MLKTQFYQHGNYLIQEDITMLEASMLFEWLDNFDNLDKKPMFDLEYVMPIPEDLAEPEIEKYLKEDCMNEAVSVYEPGVIALIDLFTIRSIEEIEIRLFVIYTYYNKEEQPLYVGYSKDFYNAHT